ncbi:hypothetical protein E8E14_000431 [Neopestalotiopsis sp. 37M]|nr:hypothetical protein E8E14_000431 [Neopestalotiopsis sp. 37M]
MAYAPKKEEEKDSFSSSDDNIILHVVDGGRVHQHHVSKSVLCHKAAIFAELTVTPVIKYNGWRLETVQSFVTWLNTGTIEVRGLVNGRIEVKEALKFDVCANIPAYNMGVEVQGSGNTFPKDVAPWYSVFDKDPLAHILGRVLDLYVFACQGGITSLVNDCVLVWQRLLCAPYNVVLYSPLLNAVFRRAKWDSPLSRFLIDWTACTMHDGEWEPAKLVSLPPVALAEILRQTLRRANYGVDTLHGLPNPNLDWCHYHEHPEMADRCLCMNSRPDDWDVQNSSNASSAMDTPSSTEFKSHIALLSNSVTPQSTEDARD